ncbi:MAG: insulinase family protein [Chloroflexi bacterium]|nr:insulinase family protein [Chloroflexota bacterium]
MSTTTAEAGIAATDTRLPNGVRVLHSFAPSNPSVVVRLLVRAGASRETPEQQGLARLAGRMLRQGTERIDKDALAEELDGMGAGLSVDVGYALTTISIKCLAEDFRRSLELLAGVALKPTFPERELEAVRGQALTELREMDDNTRVVAERLWREMAYPADHRYHRLTAGTDETLRRFTRDDLAAFHRRTYTPDQATLIVVGDVAAEAVRQESERVLGDWQGSPQEDVRATLPWMPDPPGGSREHVLEGKTQADLVIGLPAIERTDPDYYALAFANHILGRIYFMGRFGEKVRDEQGLAYYAYSELGAGYGRGAWSVRAGVNPRNLDSAIASIHAEIERFLRDGPTEAEMQDGVTSLVGSLPRQVETNEGVAAVLAEVDLFELGLDYLERYPSIVRALTHEQVLAAARRHIKPASLITAIAGPARAEEGSASAPDR